MLGLMNHDRTSTSDSGSLYSSPSWNDIHQFTWVMPTSEASMTTADIHYRHWRHPVRIACLLHAAAVDHPRRRFSQNHDTQVAGWCKSLTTIMSADWPSIGRLIGLSHATRPALSAGARPAPRPTTRVDIPWHDLDHTFSSV